MKIKKLWVALSLLLFCFLCLNWKYLNQQVHVKTGNVHMFFRIYQKKYVKMK